MERNVLQKLINWNNSKQINENTLLIFDEVQECPNIVSSLKYFCQGLLRKRAD